MPVFHQQATIQPAQQLRPLSSNLPASYGTSNPNQANCYFTPPHNQNNGYHQTWHPFTNASGLDNACSSYQQFDNGFVTMPPHSAQSNQTFQPANVVAKPTSTTELSLSPRSKSTVRQFQVVLGSNFSLTRNLLQYISPFSLHRRFETY